MKYLRYTAPLFIVKLPEAHLTSYSRMSSSAWLWLSESLRPFLFLASVYSCHFLASSPSVRSLTVSLLYHAHHTMKISFYISRFLKEISHLSHYFFFSLFLCTVYLMRLSYLFFLFFGTQHLAGYVFFFFIFL